MTVLFVMGMVTTVPQAVGDQGRGASRPVQIQSVPVSPSVVATAATKGSDLVLLVLWRGAPGWYRSGGGRGAPGGGDQHGRIHATLAFGDQALTVSFDPQARTAVVQDKHTSVSAQTNVLLVATLGRKPCG